MVSLVPEQATASALETSTLSPSFFEGMRKELSRKKLKELAKYTANIPLPEEYGHFRNEAHYLATMKLMLKSTEETRHCGYFLKQFVIPQLKQKQSLLDVGPGDGQLLTWIGDDFDSIVALDSNADVLEQLNKNPKILHNKTKLTKIQSCITSFDGNIEQFDLLLLSQVLYYVNPDLWFKTVNTCFNLVKPGGILFIALSGDANGKAELINHFGGSQIDIDKLTQQCITAYSTDTVKSFAIQEKFSTYGLTPMLHIAGFLLHDVGIKTDESSLSNYLKTNTPSENGYYSMTSQQKFILIRKHI